MRRFILGLTAAVTCLLLLLAAAAAAKSVEFGNPCTAELPAGGGLFEIASKESPLPAAAPISGVLTEWKMSFSSVGEPLPLQQVVRVVRVIGSEQVKVIAKSSVEEVRAGANSFETRLPIEAGDHLALSSSEGAPVGDLQCHPASENFYENEVGVLEQPLPGPGGTEMFNSEYGLRVPVVGVIEPDVDGDGYGDETQDGCPQSAAFQANCPVVSFAPAYSVGQSGIEVRVKSSAQAPVAVTAALPGASGSLRAEKTLAAGRFASFHLAFSRRLEAALTALDSGKSMAVKLRAHASNVHGAVSSDRLTVRLPGRG